MFTSRFYICGIMGLALLGSVSSVEGQHVELHPTPQLRPRLESRPRVDRARTVLRPRTDLAPKDELRLGFYGRFVPGTGMVVHYVILGMPAARLGIETGDVIVQINSQPLTSEDDYLSALRSSGGNGNIFLRDVRTGQLVLVPLNLPDSAPSPPFADDSDPGASDSHEDPNSDDENKDDSEADSQGENANEYFQG